MDGQELIQVNLQLPASALDGLAKLTEQLRKLTAVVSGLGKPYGTSEEIVESNFFDWEQFQALRQQSEEAARRSSRTEDTEAQAVRSDISMNVLMPEGAGWDMERVGSMQDQEDSLRQYEARELELDIQEEHSSRREPAEEIPVVHPATEVQMQEAPAVRMEPGNQIPETEETGVQAREAEFPFPAAPEAISAEMELPPGAEMVITAPPELSVSRWANLTEELVTAGPAPLTAEAVSLAFQRDGRRYDNGFPLY